MLLWCLSACDRVEIPVEAHDPGLVITSSVSLDPDYKWQVYFDLETNQVVGKNLKTEWDLGFSTDPNGYEVVLNSSKGMFVSSKENIVFEAVADTVGFEHEKGLDAPTGNLDSTAIGDWRNLSKVYVIDRGYDELGRHQGFKKLEFLSVDQAAYTVRLADLDGNDDAQITIGKDTSYNFSFLSLEGTGSIKQIEPPKRSWDLCFGQYMELLPEPYLVTGALLNRFQTSAAMDSSIQFQEVDFQFANAINKQSAIQVIGYSWKYYDFDSALFDILAEMNFLIKDNHGLIYKLHFTDFYNDLGVKGTPTWEYQQL